MPSKNSIKNYIANGYYHIYNRGVEKRKIFLDKQDYSLFLSYLKTYLLPKNISDLQLQLSKSSDSFENKGKILKLISLNNFAHEITLLCYCLMPNHFHLLIRQKSHISIDRFINSLCTRYVIYFNKKYKRIGPLFQGVYKATTIEKDEQLLYLSAYIHRNPWKLLRKDKRTLDPIFTLTRIPSSLPEYLGIRKTSWIDSKEILFLFGNNISKYKNFVLQNDANLLSSTIKIDR